MIFRATVTTRPNPLYSSAERDVVLLEHRVKAEEGNEYHKAMKTRIDNSIKKIEDQKARKTRMAGRRLTVNLMGEDMHISAEEIRNYFWDYNTVEMVLLACSILVCLAGVMFESDRFVGRQDLDYQRLLISVGVMLVIMFSCFYYGIVLLSEVTGHTPAWVQRWMAKNKWGSNLKKGLGGDDSDSDDDGIEMGMASNPMHSTKDGKTTKKADEKIGVVEKERDAAEAMNKKLMKQLKLEKEKNLRLSSSRSSTLRGHKRQKSKMSSRKGFAQKMLGGKQGSTKSLLALEGSQPSSARSEFSSISGGSSRGRPAALSGISVKDEAAAAAAAAAGVPGENRAGPPSLHKRDESEFV